MDKRMTMGMALIVLITITYIAGSVVMHELAHITAGEYFGYEMSGIKMGASAVYVTADEIDGIEYNAEDRRAMYHAAAVVDGIHAAVIPLGVVLVMLLSVLIIFRVDKHG